MVWGFPFWGGQVAVLGWLVVVMSRDLSVIGIFWLVTFAGR